MGRAQLYMCKYLGSTAVPRPSGQTYMDFGRGHLHTALYWYLAESAAAEVQVTQCGTDVVQERQVESC